MPERHSDDGSGDVVVLGGYGAVGRVVTRTLADLHPGRVVVAGRDERAAATFAARVPGVRARRVDVGLPDELSAVLDGAAAVVMCVERANAEVAVACLERGVHVVDVAATPGVIAAIEALDAIAEDGGAVAALSVGLAPGLTNVLARLCATDLPGATSIDIALLLGLGGDHGKDSVRWTVDGLVTTDTSGAGRARVDLPGFGVRSAYPFPFSDQHTLAAHLGIPVTTRLCFDSAVLTGAAFALRTAGVLRLLRGSTGRRMLTSALHRVRLGSDDVVVHVTATRGAETLSWAARGRDTSQVTGLITALTAHHVITAGPAPGVVHLEDLIDPLDLVAQLRGHGIEITAGGVRPDPARRHP
ncbi:Saccharopine dehydrogenase NADP binding domain-containing protein [Pseudonocardia thermophila]|uniref:Saccharopine dehydrogenase NADP binding domain-containing protein n=1 Tax=Pseudonocardia thermophila TaxID=1848 RepID=A0A1M6TR72_PSETH|nr:saccharopine dehydrogenase NADP-binding domain-containing protein [Pseudonocardia thermophila]SHK59434.1 Saccharopine dehydrogenase NADP binding domain-containing protein [Pseudonocardia thermophila]